MSRMLLSLRLLSVTLIVLLGLVVGGPAGARAAPRPATPDTTTSDLYAAIAFSPSSGVVGSAWNYDDLTSAQGRALYECFSRGVSDCRTVVWVRNGYAALARSYNGAWGTGWSTNYGYAESGALITCNNLGGVYCRTLTVVGTSNAQSAPAAARTGDAHRPRAGAHSR